MAKVPNRNTKPEILVRSLLHRLGYRFRLHRKDLPGKPDIVLPSRKAAIMVHGCFWHQHPGCKKASVPETRKEFWEVKLLRNVARDVENLAALEERGWKVLTVWECATKDTVGLSRTLREFLTNSDNASQNF